MTWESPDGRKVRLYLFKGITCKCPKVKKDSLQPPEWREGSLKLPIPSLWPLEVGMLVSDRTMERPGVCKPSQIHKYLRIYIWNLRI